MSHKEQPAPKPSTGDLWLNVISTHKRLGNLTEPLIEAMLARRRVGIERYGTPLQPFNGRDVIRDLREELLDAIVYLEQAAVEGHMEPHQAATLQTQLIDMLGVVGRNEK